MSNTIRGGRYREIRLLGEGGRGAVFLVEDTLQSNRQVALKVLHRELLDADELASLQREFRILANLRHPNISRAFDYGRFEETGDSYFTSEFIEGNILTEVTDKIPFEDRYEIAVQICRALEYVHSRGIVHHDVKTNNILIASRENAAAGDWPEELLARAGLLSEGGRVIRWAKLIDFGLIEPEKKAAGKLVGSPSFIPPEKIQGLPTDRRSDLYSLGVVFYRMFTGQMPITGSDVVELLQRHLSATIRPPSDIDAAFPKPLESVILKLLEKRPEKRFQSAAEVIGAFNDGLGRNFPIETEYSRRGYVTSVRMVGRDHPFRILQEALGAIEHRRREAAADAGARAFLVSGDHGVGKTRLLDEFRQYAQVRGAVVAEAVCAPVGRPLDAPLVRIVKQARSVAQPPDLGRLPTSLRGDDAGFLRFLKGPGGEEASREAWLRPVRDFVLAVSRRLPLVVSVDNIQWADEWTWHLMVSLARAAASDGSLGLVVVGALRESAPGETKTRTIGVRTGEDAFQRIRIVPLEEAAVRDMLRSLFGGERLPEAFFRRLSTLSGGNPLFIEEILKSLIDQGRITRHGSRWSFTQELAGAEMPESLSGVLLQRARDLDTESRQVLDLLSVLDEPTILGGLQGVLSIPPETLLARLRALKEKQLLRSVEEGQGAERQERWSFFQSRFGEEWYHLMAAPKRLEWHARVGRFLESSPAALEEREEVLAHHFFLARDMERAIRYGLVAADRSRNRMAYREATRMLERVSSSLGSGSPPLRMRVDWELLNLYETVGEPERASEKAEALLSRSGSILGRAKRQTLLRRRATNLIVLGRFREAETALQEAEGMLSGEGESTDRALVGTLRAELDLRQGDLTRAREHAQKVLAYGRKWGWENFVREKEAPAIFRIGGLCEALSGHFEEALKNLAEGVQVVRGLGLLREEARLHIVQASVFRETGRLADAEKALAEGAALVECHPDDTGAAEAALERLELALARGDLPAALRLGREAAALAEILPQSRGLARVERATARIYLKIGQYPRAFETLQKAALRARTEKDRDQELRIMLERAWTLLVLDGPSAAGPEFEKVEREAKFRGFQPHLARARWGVGLSKIASGDREGGGKILEEAESSFRSIGLARERCEILLSGARSRMESKDAEGFRRAMEEIRACVEAIGAADLHADLLSLEGEWRLIEGRLEEGLEALDRARDEASRGKYLGNCLRMDLLRSIVLDALDRKEPAARAREDAKRDAEEMASGFTPEAWARFQERLGGWLARRRAILTKA